MSALSSGAFPKSYSRENETDFDRALKEAKSVMTDNAWTWEITLWVTAGSATEMLELEQLPIVDLARTRLHQLFKS